MTFLEWIKTEAGQRALEYAEHAPGAGLSMAWDAAINAAAIACEDCLAFDMDDPGATAAAVVRKLSSGGAS